MSSIAPLALTVVVVCLLAAGVSVLLAVRCLRRERAARGQAAAESERLRAALSHQASIFEQVTEAIMTFDLEDRTTSWNRGAERLYGVPAASILGRRFTDVLSFRFAQADMEAHARERLRANERVESEFLVTRPDGSQVLVGGTIGPLRDPDGRVIGRIAVLADIGARKRAELELRVRARQQAAVAALGQRALADIDLDLVLDQAVALVAHTLGVPAVGLLELRPESDHFVLRAGSGWPAGQVGTLTLSAGRDSHAGQLLLSGRPLTVENLALDSRIAADPLLTQAGVRALVAVAVHGARQPFGVLGAYDMAPRPFTRDDVHFLQAIANVLGASIDRRRSDDERRRLEAQMTHVQKLESLGVLAGGIAHDFNNLLVSIMGHVGLAQMDLPPESPILARLRHIETASQRAAELTSQMLAYSGRGRFVVRPVDLSRLVEEMGHLLHTAIAKTATLVFDCARNLPPINGDPSQLRQVVMNLITNASDAIGDQPGTIRLRTGLVHAGRDLFRTTYLGEDLPAGDYVFVEVRDTGCGMSRETLARIFDPFFTTKFTGRGLGLAAVLGIVRGHRGAIRIETAPGAGTTFEVYFPAVPAARAADAADAPGEVPDWRGRGTVLVVDDEDGVRDIAQSVLERAGLTVVTAADGREGLDAFLSAAASFDAVLLDMTMPRLDGATVLREIRRVRRDLPVILSTGFGEPDQIAELRTLGAVFFIQKPYTPGSLVRLVREVLAPPLQPPPRDRSVPGDQTS
ncbi:MAG: response regulator [Acidobacteriota bacterium]